LNVRFAVTMWTNKVIVQFVTVAENIVNAAGNHPSLHIRLAPFSPLTIPIVITPLRQKTSVLSVVSAQFFVSATSPPANQAGFFNHDLHDFVFILAFKYQTSGAVHHLLHVSRPSRKPSFIQLKTITSIILRGVAGAARRRF